jgi:hypothetical protein
VVTSIIEKVDVARRQKIALDLNPCQSLVCKESVRADYNKVSAQQTMFVALLQNASGQSWKPTKSHCAVDGRELVQPGLQSF